MNCQHPFAFDHRNRHSPSLFAFGNGGGEGFECPAYSWNVMPSWQYVAVRLHVDRLDSKVSITTRMVLRQKGRFAAKTSLFLFQVLGSILACVRDVFSWSFNRRFGPLRSPLSLAGSLNRMIRGSDEYYWPIVRKQTSFTVGIVAGELTEVKPVLVPFWYLKERLSDYF